MTGFVSTGRHVGTNRNLLGVLCVGPSRQATHIEDGGAGQGVFSEASFGQFHLEAAGASENPGGEVDVQGVLGGIFGG